MPSVTVHLYASLREHIGGQLSADVEMTAGDSIEQLLSSLGVPGERVRIIFCNNRLVDRSFQLAGGETVGVFPAVGGG